MFARPEVIPEVASQDYKLIKVFPYIFVLVMALIGVNVFVVLASGVILSGFIGLFYGDFTLLSFWSRDYIMGFTNMTENILCFLF